MRWECAGIPECAGITHTHASTLESRFNVKCSAATRQGQCAQEQLDRDDMHKSNQTGGPIHTRATRQEGRYTQGQPDRRADIHKSNQTGGPADTSATRQELAQRTVADFEMGTCTKDSARSQRKGGGVMCRWHIATSRVGRAPSRRPLGRLGAQETRTEECKPPPLPWGLKGAWFPVGCQVGTESAPVPVSPDPV